MSTNEIGQNSLEALWRKAELLGKIVVQPDLNGIYRHQVTISYHRRSGTFICARGASDEVTDAFQRAIAEAATFKY